MEEIVPGGLASRALTWTERCGFDTHLGKINLFPKMDV